MRSNPAGELDGEAEYVRGLARRRAREGSIVEWPGRRLPVPDRLRVRRIRDPEELWLRAAQDVLMSCARQYKSVVYFRDLGGLVEARSGVRPQGYLTWMHTTLQTLTERCVRLNEPVLPALCVDEDGTATTGYVRAMKALGHAESEIEQLAAKHRLRCYRHFNATGLPVDGGSLMLSEDLARQPFRPPEPATSGRRQTARLTTWRGWNRNTSNTNTVERQKACPNCNLIHAGDCL